MTSVNIVQHFENVRLSDMRLSSLVVVPSGRKVRSVVAAMAAQHTGCAVITDGARLSGIFTERDITRGVVRSPETWDAPVDRFMTAEPTVIGHHASAIEALRTMNARRFRNLPVTGTDGDLLGSINLRTHPAGRVLPGVAEQAGPRVVARAQPALRGPHRPARPRPAAGAAR